MALIHPGTAFAPVEVARGVVVEERAQETGECAQSDSGAHVFVLQSISVAKAFQRWEGKRRIGAMAAGQLSVLPAGLPMSWQWQGRVQSLHVSVDARQADVLAAPSLGRPTVELPSPFLVDDALTRHWLQTLRMEAVVGADLLRCEQLVQLLLGRLGPARRGLRRPAGQLSQKRLNDVLEWVEDNLSQPITVTDLAAVAGVEASWFTRLFSRAVGRSPYKYVLERRVLHAQYAIRSGRPPAVAAAALGFVDQSHMTRHFKRLAGHTPGRFQRAAR
jgi:AraC family transcriptional regulator